MTMRSYEETLEQFGLSQLKGRLDIQLSAGGNIVLTRDGDWQMGDRQANALFRLVERWRLSEPTLCSLFEQSIAAATDHKKLSKARMDNEGPLLHKEPRAYHMITDAILELQSISSVLAGSIFVVLNNLLQRLKHDLSSAEHAWRSAGPLFGRFSFGQIVAASAANFRHYDEWAGTDVPTKVQLASMEILIEVLDRPLPGREALRRFAQMFVTKCFSRSATSASMNFIE